MIEILVDIDLEDVIPSFIKNRFKDIDEMKQSFKNNDIEKIQFIAHSLKGVGSGYGFDEVTKIGKELELLAKNKENQKLLPLILQLEDYMNKVHITYVEME